MIKKLCLECLLYLQMITLRFSNLLGSTEDNLTAYNKGTYLVRMIRHYASPVITPLVAIVADAPDICSHHHVHPFYSPIIVVASGQWGWGWR